MAAKLEPKPSDPAAVLLQAHTRLSSTFFCIFKFGTSFFVPYHQAVRAQMEEHGGPMQALNFMLPDPESVKELSIINHFHYPPHAFPPTPSNLSLSLHVHSTTCQLSVAWWRLVAIGLPSMVGWAHRQAFWEALEKSFPKRDDVEYATSPDKVLGFL